MLRPTSPPTLAAINREAYIYFGAGVTVAWQLAKPRVGRGVARHSRTLDHPLQRLRATMSYVYAVTLGTDVDRAAIARHVNHAHRPVMGPGYNAFDRDLQLWVAATLYRGAVDVYEFFVGPVPAHAREALYGKAGRSAAPCRYATRNGRPTAWRLTTGGRRRKPH
jgi:uncharacterized protein (DUF2236 family)